MKIQRKSFIKATEDLSEKEIIFDPSNPTSLKEGDEFEFAQDIYYGYAEDFDPKDLEGFKLEPDGDYGDNFVIIPEGAKGKLLSSPYRGSWPVILVNDKLKLDFSGDEFKVRLISKNTADGSIAAKEEVENTLKMTNEDLDRLFQKVDSLEYFIEDEVPLEDRKVLGLDRLLDELYKVWQAAKKNVDKTSNVYGRYGLDSVDD